MNEPRFLDPRWHRDPGLFETLRERTLSHAWHLLDPAALPSVEETGVAMPLHLAPGALDEALLALRDDEGELRLLSNVCTHRGALLCEGKTHGPRLRCPYHGRVFDLTGRALSAPGFDVAEFPDDADHLPSIAVHREETLELASLDPAIDAATWFAPVRSRVPTAYRSKLRPDPEAAHSYELDAGWLLYLENFLEGLHIPFVHPALRAALDPDDYRVETFDHGVLQIGFARDGDPAFDLPSEHPEAGRRVAAWYFFLFPNTLLNFYPWGLSANVVTPLAPQRTRIDYWRWVADATLLERGAGVGLDQVEREDQAVVRRVQRGIRSRLYRGGRAAPKQEDGVLLLHRLLARAIEDPSDLTRTAPRSSGVRRP